MRRSLLTALAALIGATPAAAQSSPFQTKSCPIPAEVAGYPVWAQSAGGADLDPGYASALADAVARRWAPPSPGRGDYTGLRALRSRIQPPEPRWPQDWSPTARDTARLAVTLFRDARPGPVQLLSRSGNRVFDRSVAEHFRDPAPASPSLPPLPAGADSVRVVIGFGIAPPAGAGAVRFAAQQTPAQLTPGSFRMPPLAPRTGAVQAARQAIIKYDIDEAGRITPGSTEVLASNGILASAIVDALFSARATPAVSNCRPVASSVVQRFRAR